MHQTMNQLLDNITWFTLTGPHAQYACGAKDARRYAPGFSPIIGFADPASPDFDTLAAYCQPDEQLYCPQWKGEAPADWSIHVEKSCSGWSGIAIRDTGLITRSITKSVMVGSTDTSDRRNPFLVSPAIS